MTGTPSLPIQLKLFKAGTWIAVNFLVFPAAVWLLWYIAATSLPLPKLSYFGALGLYNLVSIFADLFTRGK